MVKNLVNVCYICNKVARKPNIIVLNNYRENATTSYVLCDICCDMCGFDIPTIERAAEVVVRVSKVNA